MALLRSYSEYPSVAPVLEGGKIAARQWTGSAEVDDLRAEVLRLRQIDRAATSGAFAFHQPVWALLRDMESVALLSVDGSVHTSTGEVDLAAAFEQAGRSISAMTAALFGDYLP